MPKRKYYAVSSGRKTGIFHSWEECKAQVRCQQQQQQQKVLVAAIIYLCCCCSCASFIDHSSSFVHSLSSCQVHKYSGATYKSFPLLQQAQDYLSGGSSHLNNSSGSTETAAGTKRTSKPPPPGKQRPNASNHTASKESGETSRKRPRTDTPSATSIEAATTTTTTAGSTSQHASSKRFKGSSSPSSSGSKDDDDNSNINNNNGVQIHIMFDGGARGNPGIAGAGAVVSILRVFVGTANNETANANTTETAKIIYIRDFVGTNATNNQAEYTGLLTGLQVALQQCGSSKHLGQQQQQQKRMMSIQKLIVQGDSQLIIKQLHGNYQVKSQKLKPLFEQVQALLQQIKTDHSCPVVALEHVYRNENKLADRKLLYYRLLLTCETKEQRL